MLKKRRILYAVLFGVILLTEIYIALYVRDAFVRPYVGDVLVTMLLGCLVRVLFPTGVRLLSVYILAFATAVEFLQYIDIVRVLGLENSAFLSTIIGRSFSVWDLVCYAVGCLAFFGIERLAEHGLNRT